MLFDEMLYQTTGSKKKESSDILKSTKVPFDQNKLSICENTRTIDQKNKFSPSSARVESYRNSLMSTKENEPADL